MTAPKKLRRRSGTKTRTPGPASRATRNSSSCTSTSSSSTRRKQSRWCRLMRWSRLVHLISLQLPHFLVASFAQNSHSLGTLFRIPSGVSTPTPRSSPFTHASQSFETTLKLYSHLQ
eukprot:g64138.t1